MSVYRYNGAREALNHVRYSWEIYLEGRYGYVSQSLLRTMKTSSQIRNMSCSKPDHVLFKTLHSTNSYVLLGDWT